jgi:hypothetical protein
VIPAAKRYAETRPWSGTRAKRIRSLKRFYSDICIIYGVEPPLLNIRGLGKGDSGSSAYVPVFKIIYLHGRLSVVTAIHELGHHLGMDEMAACRWSLNLFKRVWPEQFAKCFVDRHMLRRFDPNSGRQRTENEPDPRPKLD